MISLEFYSPWVATPLLRLSTCYRLHSHSLSTPLPSIHHLHRSIMTAPYLHRLPRHLHLHQHNTQRYIYSFFSSTISPLFFFFSSTSRSANHVRQKPDNTRRKITREMHRRVKKQNECERIIIITRGLSSVHVFNDVCID